MFISTKEVAVALLKVNLDKFGKRLRVGWKIEPDRGKGNSYSDSAWKLYNKNGQHVATLDKNGKILRP